jgi:hypothetical protein
MTFGKRQSRAGVAAQALNADMTVAQSRVVTETAHVAGNPFRWLIVLLACGVTLYGLMVRTSCATIAWLEPGNRRMICEQWMGSVSEQIS